MYTPSLLIAAVGAMVISTNGPLPVQGFQPQLVKPSNPVNRYSSSKTRLAKGNVQYDRHKHALFAVSIAADDILTTSMEEQKSTSQCPFAFCHGKQGGGTSLPPLLSNSRHQRTTLFQTKKTLLSSVISPSKVLMFNFKRAIFTFIAKGLFFSKAIRIRNQQLPQSLNSKRIESKLSKSDRKYIETLFDVICEKEHLINLKLPQQAVGDKNELSIAFKFNFVAGVISERLEIKNVKNIVPSYHPEYDTAMRDMINTFLVFSSGFTYEQVLNDPRVTPVFTFVLLYVLC